MTRILDVAGGKSTHQQNALLSTVGGSCSKCQCGTSDFPLQCLSGSCCLILRVNTYYYDASTPVPFGVLNDVEVSVVHLTMVQQYVCLVFVFGWRVCVGGGALGSFSS